MGRRRNRQSKQQAQPDIDINAYANSERSGANDQLGCRLPKHNYRLIKTESQQNHITPLDDDRIAAVDEEEPRDNAEPTCQPLMLSEVSRKTTDLPLNLAYPNDIWHLIGSYIEPEDVGTFARLCKATSNVVRTTSFWWELYRRACVDNESKLPASLRSYRLRSNGLRSNVIKAIHLAHRPFSIKNKDYNIHSVPARAIDVMQSSRCVSANRLTPLTDDYDPMWECAIDGLPDRSRQQLPQPPQAHLHKFRILFTRQIAAHTPKIPTTGVFANEKEHLGQLYIVADKPNRQAQLSSIINKRLIKLSMNLSRDMRSYHLHMQFADRPLRARAIGNVVHVSLTSVCLVRYLDWWHPEFDHIAHTT